MLGIISIRDNRVVLNRTIPSQIGSDDEAVRDCTAESAYARSPAMTTQTATSTSAPATRPWLDRQWRKDVIGNPFPGRTA